MAKMYDRSSEFWQMLYNVFKMAEKVRAADHQKMHKSTAVKWAQFWARTRGSSDRCS